MFKMKKIYTQIEEELKKGEMALAASLVVDENRKEYLCILACPLNQSQGNETEVYRVSNTKDNLQDLQSRLRNLSEKYRLSIIRDDTDPLNTMRKIIKTMIEEGRLGLAIGFDVDEDDIDYLYIEAVFLDETQKDEEIYTVPRRRANVFRARRWIHTLSDEFNIPILWDHTQTLSETKKAN